MFGTQCIVLSFLLCFAITTYSQSSDTFLENLWIKHLPDGRLSLTFEFVTTTLDSDDSTTRYFPDPIKSLVQKHGVENFDLSLTQGRWNYDSWGIPKYAAPVGAKLVSSFIPSNRTVESQWNGLVHSLGGLFCASLNFFDLSNSKSYAAGIVGRNKASRYATLSNEVVCTENLTPFKSILPSRGKCGLSRFLNPIKVYDTSFHSMGIHFNRKNGLTLLQTVSIVVNLQSGSFFQNWDLSHIMSVHDVLKCPFAKSTTINVVKDQNFDKMAMKRSVAVSNDHHVDLESKSDSIGVSVSWKEKIPIITEQKHNTEISTSKYEKSYGLHGKLVTRITNHASRDIKISFYETIPWYFRIYFSTLVLRVNGTQIPLPSMRLKNAQLHGRPYEIEFDYTIMRHATLELSLDFDKVYLHISDHSPDANRGFDLSSSVIKYDLAESDAYNSTKAVVYSESLLIMLPTPDFSMPYNVICLCCTAIALFLGGTFSGVLNPKEKRNI